MNGQTHPSHPPRPTSDHIACVLSAAFIQKPQRARQAQRDGLRPAHFPKPLQSFLEGIAAPKPNIERLRQDVSTYNDGFVERLVERHHTFNDEEIQRYIQFLIDGGATIGPGDQLLGLMLKHGIPPSAVRLQYDHFKHHDLAELFEVLSGAEEPLFPTAENHLSVDYYRKELVTRPNDHNARLAVWLADCAAPTAVDPDNPLEDPHDIVQRLAEEIRGRNDRPPSSSAEQTAPSPDADQKPATKTSTAAKPQRETRISNEAELIEGARSLMWLSHAGKMSGLSHLEAHVLLFIAAHISGGKRGTGAAFPSVATIAGGIGADLRNVRRATDHLVELCLIAVVPGGGRTRSNTYKIALPKNLAATGKGEPKSETRAPPEPQKKVATKVTTPAHRLPPDWMPSPKAQEWAIARLGQERATSELAKFKDWFPSKGIEHSDWEATWRNWVRRRTEWDTGTAKPRGRNP